MSSWYLTTGYFDDFLVLATRAEAQSVTLCVQLVFKTLGWAYARSGPKAPDFAELFHALGVTIDVAGLHLGKVLVSNTEQRRQELIHQLTAVLESGKLSQMDALRLRGRLQFAAGNVFGRIAKASLNVVSAHAYHSCSPVIDEKSKLASRLHRKLLTGRLHRHAGFYRLMPFMNLQVRKRLVESEEFSLTRLANP